MFDIGDAVTVEDELVDKDGKPTDPIVLNFAYRTPSGIPIAGAKGAFDNPYSYPTDPEITRDSIGRFHFDITATEAGVYFYRWWGQDIAGNSMGATEDRFSVRESQSSMPVPEALYIGQDDIEGRLSEAKLIQLTDYDALGVVDESKVNDCISSACSIIDSYCGGRYTLPLTVSAQIRDAALSIAIYKLHVLRQIAPEKVRQEFEDAIAYLKDVAAGRATLEQGTVTQSISAEVVTRNHTTDPEAFDNTRLSDYIG